jgi:hypothetical protein
MGAWKRAKRVVFFLVLLCCCPGSSGRTRADMRRQEKTTNGEHAQPLPSVGVGPLTEISMMSDSRFIHGQKEHPIIPFKLTPTADRTGGEYEKHPTCTNF